MAVDEGLQGALERSRAHRNEPQPGCPLDASAANAPRRSSESFGFRQPADVKDDFFVLRQLS